MPARARLPLLVMAMLLAACQSGQAGQPSSASPSASAPPTGPATPTLKPDVPPRPTDLPTNGACEEGHSCLGLLKARSTYRTAVFKPQITFTMPASGWENLSDEGGVFPVLSVGSPGDGIFFFRDPTATNPDGKPVAGVGSSVPELAAWLSTNDQLAVSAAKPVTVGGLKGLVMDVRIARDATSPGPRDCPTRICVPYFAAADPSPRPVWGWDWGLAGTETNRLYLLTAQEGVVAVIVESVDGTTFDLMTTAADQILPTVTFG